MQWQQFWRKARLLDLTAIVYNVNIAGCKPGTQEPQSILMRFTQIFLQAKVHKVYLIQYQEFHWSLQKMHGFDWPLYVLVGFSDKTFLLVNQEIQYLCQKGQVLSTQLQFCDLILKLLHFHNILKHLFLSKHSHGLGKETEPKPSRRLPAFCLPSKPFWKHITNIGCGN